MDANNSSVTRNELFSIAVLLKIAEGKPLILLSETNLAAFGFFEKEQTCEILIGVSTALVEKTATGAKSSESVEGLLYPSVCYVHIREDNLSGAVISELKYPEEAIHDLITKVLNEFAKEIPADKWSSLEEGKAPFTLEKYLSEHAIVCEKVETDNDKKVTRKNKVVEKLQEETDMVKDEAHTLSEDAQQRMRYLLIMEKSMNDFDVFEDRSYLCEQRAIQLQAKSSCCTII